MLATLQGAQISDDGPSVRHRHITAVRQHGVFTVGDGVKNLAVSHLANALVLQGGDRVQAIQFGDAIAGCSQTMTNGTVDIETLLPTLHELFRDRNWNARTPIVPHLAGVVIISALAEADAVAGRFRLRRVRSGRNFRQRFHLRLWHFVANWDRVRDRKTRPATVSEKVDWRLRPHFLLPHHVRENFPRCAGAMFSAKTAHRHDDDTGEHEDEKEASQHFNPPRARW